MAGNFAKRVEDTIETMLGGTKKKYTPDTNQFNTDAGQSNLEKIGFAVRKDHLLRNEWGKDVVYTKQLVVSEYLIQNEFKVGDDLEQVKAEQEASKKKELEAKEKKLSKLEQRIIKLGDRINDIKTKTTNELIK